MTIEFMSPYQVQKILKGVIPANELVRPNWLQTFFNNESTTESDTLNFDFEFQTKNTMGMFVNANADVTPIQLSTFGTAELRPAYAKEGLNSPDYEELRTRRIGQQFGQMNDPLVNEALDLQAKLAIAEQRFENLFELVSRDILLDGGYIAESEKHPRIAYNFGRQVVTNEATLLKGYVPQVDLTTLNANGGVGKRAWDSTGGTKGVSPMKDLIIMYNTASRRQNNVRTCLMSTDAYELLESDLLTNYKDASTLTQSVLMRIEQKILPMTEQFQGLNYRRSVPVGLGRTLDIFTYDSIYHDRVTGEELKYIPNGRVVLIPERGGNKTYFRIKHRKANYQAMPRFINYWEDAKSAKREWEVHTSFIMGHTDINSVVSWKVTSN